MSQVLIIDDQPGDLLWLLDLLDARGYGHTLATNGKEGRARLAAVKAETEAYALAIIDVGVATLPIEDLMLEDLDDKFFQDSRDTGIHLCRYARKELGLSARDLPIVCLTVRDDDAVQDAMRELGIQLFHRAPHSSSESIRGFIEENLKPLT